MDTLEEFDAWLDQVGYEGVDREELFGFILEGCEACDLNYSERGSVHTISTRADGLYCLCDECFFETEFCFRAGEEGHERCGQTIDVFYL